MASTAAIQSARAYRRAWAAACTTATAKAPVPYGAGSAAVARTIAAAAAAVEATSTVEPATATGVWHGAAVGPREFPQALLVIGGSFAAKQECKMRVGALPFAHHTFHRAV